MGWKRFIPDIGILADKKKMWSENLRCPYHGCPSNTPFTGARRARMKFMQRITPMVYQYKCKWCGCLVTYGADHPGKTHQSERPYVKNPALVVRKDLVDDASVR